MKRHIQQPGVRQWAGEDLIELQAEPLKAIDGFFAEYGPCIIQGCQIADNGDGTYDITSGLLALAGTDVNGNNTFKVAPFSGISSVPFPVYFTLAYSTVERSYMDGQVKPIAYNYRAEVNTVRPTGKYLELSEDNITRFVDVIQCDAAHRFFTDEERKKLNGIDAGANKYVHPNTHPASMIAEDSTHKFMTQSEKNTLSSLETKADLVNAKNLGQNGYKKYEDGMLIQWGYSSGSTASKTIYFPVSFVNANYSTIISINSSMTNYVLAPIISFKAASYFKTYGKSMLVSSIGETSEPISWIAIGCWK